MPCRLCLKDVPLRASHIVPKWAWKKARGEGQENPNVVNVHGGVAVQTSAQITEKLLCDECEQRLGRHDGYVGSLVYAQDGVAPIFGRLRHRFSIGRNSDETTYRYLLLDGLDADGIGRFGVSVLWRSHVAQRRDAGQVDLGENAGAVRLFLLDQGPFPQDAVIALSVLPPDEEATTMFSRVSVVPTTNREGSLLRHEVLVCGFLFAMYTGLGLACSAEGARMRDELCLIQGQVKRALLIPARDLLMIRLIHEQVREARRV